ncbi:hypothetical protein TL16_g07421 [Triparma laevis f. inornata]|uniref:homogentisate 1,2-dioxygenase n=1 Tax=Triparma laevis f. inornata TaxID=1714386 RepID=A0A9W7B0T9_9STRA|nr:hypothetical protein TL16_g07421 [Triparma laevis f. inornata]
MFKYNAGFDSEFQTEALPGALPPFGNNPQKCPHNLYAEQLSGTAFTVPRKENRRTWFYRIQPSVLHSPFRRVEGGMDVGSLEGEGFRVDPNQMRWNPMPLVEVGENVTFVQGLKTMAGHGSPNAKTGLAIHMYTCNTSMIKQVVQTEMGWLEVPPKHIMVIPRGVVFRVEVSESSRGYVLEIFKGHFDLPDLGPIGSNGLANARDFEHPVAAYDEVVKGREGMTKEQRYDWKLINKFGGHQFETEREGTPFNVVAWHGNYSPYRYDLTKFCCINSVTFDHPDPSIYTVLTCKGDDVGTATADFVIFPERWMVMENTFRPPWYHRNCMSEFMGMVWGKYDAKEGFQAGGASLHSCMTPHGPDYPTFKGASEAELKPQKFDKG